MSNLYGAIANAFHTEPHRKISMANVAKALGAVEHKDGIRKQLSKWVRSAPNSQVGASSHDGVEPTPLDKSKSQGKLTAAASDLSKAADQQAAHALSSALEGLEIDQLYSV